MTTLLITHPDCHAHVTPPGHPEQVARLEVISTALNAPEFAALKRRDAPLARPEAVLSCHSPGHLKRVQAAIPDNGFAGLDADTHVAPGSLTAALRAVGGCISAVQEVVEGRAQNAFVACRPPGHHAERDRAMGFCLFANVSIAARYALDELGLGRVAILDFDVHHGNGTQDIMWDEPRVLFASSHQIPLYPGTGLAAETGGAGNILNVPLAPGSGSAEMRHAWADAILPAVDEFAPELILVSAGFDAHAADPLGQLNWQREDYAWLTEQIRDRAARLCGGRLVSTLEGGYDLTALADAVAAHVRVLMESD